MKDHGTAFVCVTGALILATGLSAFAEGTPATAAAEPAAAPLIRAETPAAIDGILDEPFWKAAEPIRVEYAYGKLGVKSDALPAVVRYAWDKDYLYVGYETFDANLTAAGAGEKQGPPGHQREGCRIGDANDVFEVFVSFNDPNFFWELHHNARNDFSDIWVTVAPSDSPFARSSMTSMGIHWAHREYLDDLPGGHSVATAVRMKPNAKGEPSTVNNGDDVDSGYVGEMRFPWKSLGAPTDWIKKPDGMPGRTLAIFAAADNADLEPRYHHTSSGQKITGFFHQAAAGWPRYLLTDAGQSIAAEQ